MLTEVAEFPGPVMMINLGQAADSARLPFPATMRNCLRPVLPPFLTHGRQTATLQR